MAPLLALAAACGARTSLDGAWANGPKGDSGVVAAADAGSPPQGAVDAGTPADSAAAADAGCPTGLVALFSLPHGASRGPRAIVVDETTVYWASYDEGDKGTIMSVPKCGGTPTTLVTGIYPTGIAADGTSVYWPDFDGNGSVMKVARSGGPPVTLVPDAGEPMTIAVDSANVYFDSYEDVSRVPVGGGAPVQLTTGQSVSALTVNGAHRVYWANAGGSVATLAADGSVIQLFSGPYGLWSIALDATNIYVTGTTAATDGDVMQIPIDGGATVSLATPPHADDLRAIAVDSTSVYWTEAYFGGGPTNAPTGNVMKAPIDGGAVTVLASGQDYPVSIAVDATSVYWTNLYGGTVMKLTPK